MNFDLNKFYYINLDSRTDRKRHFLNEIENIPILRDRITRFSAFDGKEINFDSLPPNFVTEEGQTMVLRNAYKKFGVDLTYGALGCALSHYTLYKECLDNNYESIVIFEDDVAYFRENFEENLLKAYELDFNEFDILYLSYYKHFQGKSSYNSNIIPKNLNKDINFVINPVVLPAFGCYAMLITNRGAKTLVENMFPITLQIDTEINSHIKDKKIKALSFDKNIVFTCSKFSSNIQGINGLKVE